MPGLFRAYAMNSGRCSPAARPCDPSHGVGVPASRVRHHSGDRPCQPIAGLRCAGNERQRADDAACNLRHTRCGCGRFDEQAMANGRHRWSLSRCNRSVRAANRPSPRCIFQATGTAATDAQNAKSRRGNAAAAFSRGSRIAWVLNREEVSVLGRPGSDLLFQVLRLSTIGAGKFDGRVRDGIGYRLPANTTRPAKDG